MTFLDPDAMEKIARSPAAPPTHRSSKPTTHTQFTSRV